MSKYGVFSGPYFPVFGLNTEIYGVNVRPLPPVFSGEIFENKWLWTSASEPFEIVACNVIRNTSRTSDLMLT